MAAWTRHPLSHGGVTLLFMRALVQRVAEAAVKVDGAIAGNISSGLCIFLGIGQNDTSEDVNKLTSKIVRLRIFADEQGKMNRSLSDTRGDLLIVSQFTLYGDTRRGNRPSYSRAADPAKAKYLYDLFIEVCRKLPNHVATGVFQAHMEVSLVNDGPVTLIVDSKE